MTVTMATPTPYGSWPSPISAESIAAGGVGIGGVSVRSTGDGSEVWWSELRPTEAGRVVLVSRTDDNAPIDRISAPYSARTRVHEYGGGAWWLGATNVYFANWEDQRVYRLPLDGDGDPEPITAAPSSPASWRYADGREHPGGDWLVCVREDHDGKAEDKTAADDGLAGPAGPNGTAGTNGTDDTAEAANEIVALGLDAGRPGQAVVLATGTDFVSSPRFSPDGAWLSWIRWNHPDMPWDSTELCVAAVTGPCSIGEIQVVGGSGGGVSIHGADWTNDGRLIYSTDESGYWNLAQWKPTDSSSQSLTALDGQEIGGPPWVFGTQRWTELSDGRLAVIITTSAVDSLGVVNPNTPGAEPTPIPSEGISAVAGLAAGKNGQLLVTAAGPTSLPGVYEIDPSGGSTKVIRPPEDTGVSPDWFSRAEAISFPSGAEKGRTAHAFFYPPTGPNLSAVDGETPPLIVMGHGGPTSHSGSALRLGTQYWTSRGFAVIDVNYGGSTGFGRAYRELLKGEWGIVDVEDCIAAASHLADVGRVDAARLAIRGGSAGGFTVLAALEQSKIFGAGTNLFGVADLSALAADTHKFESRYLDGLIGPYPERSDLYNERSPINHTDKLSSPLLVLQGLEDEIVPPSQSEAIVAAVAAKGIPHAYVAFEGEQHGFRQAANIIRSYEVELWFYGRVFGFEPADDIAPVAEAVGL